MSIARRGEDAEEYESTTQAVLEAVAGREGTDPTELEPSLHDVVDPDALNALFESTASGRPRSNGFVEFTYCGYEVTVRADGRVLVSDGAAGAD